MRLPSPPSLPERMSGQRPGLCPLPFAAVGSAVLLAAGLIAAPLAAQEVMGPPAPSEITDSPRAPSGAPEPADAGEPKDAPDEAATPAQAQVPGGYSGSMEPCLLGHGQRDLYRAGLLETGWVDISEAGRPVAIAMLADAFLPITGALDGPWAEHLAHRPASHAFWADMAQNRTLMEREGRILLLAGFLDPNGEMRVECWTAGPPTDATDSFFLLAGQVWQSEGVMMTQLNIPANAMTPESEILVSRITPPAPMEPPLAASDGLRTTTIFPMQGSQL